MVAVVIYLLTIIASVIIDKINYSVALDYVVEDGKYVIQQAFDVVFKKNYSIKPYELFIPFYNVIKSEYNGYVIVKTKDKMMQVLNSMEVLEAMNADDIEEYNKKPTPVTAKKIIKKNEREVKNSSVALFQDQSVMYFDNNKEGFNKIKRVIGPVAQEDSYEKMERLQKVNDFYREFMKRASNNSLTDEQLNELLKLPFEFDLTHIDNSMSVEEFRDFLNNNVDPGCEKDNEEQFKRILKK